MAEYHQQIIDAIASSVGFARATFSGTAGALEPRLVKVTIRPVAIKGKMHAQFAYYDAKKCIVKNYSGSGGWRADPATACPALQEHQGRVD